MQEIGARALRIAVGVGHAHREGGSPYELRRNREVVIALLAAIRASDGFEMRCYTPDDGRGTFPGPPANAAGTVMGWAADGWVADIFHEVHHQHLDDARERGGFLLFPDAPDDVDTLIRDHGDELAAILCSGIDVPPWRTGVMSERRSYVWREEHRRLSVFAATASLASTTTRFISEAAHYSNLKDREIMDSPGFAEREAYGLIEMYVHLAASWRGWSAPFQIR